MLLDKYSEEIEADLLRFFPGQVDLLDWYAGRVSARRLWVAVRALPAYGGALAQAMDREDGGEPQREPAGTPVKGTVAESSAPVVPLRKVQKWISASDKEHFEGKAL